MRATFRCAAIAALSIAVLYLPALAASNTIAAGTVITTSNWRQYQDFMPEGMRALFEGKYFWKFPSDLQIVIGPPTFHPVPKAYRENTEKYSHLVKIVNLPNGGHSIEGYVAGLPFPNPSAPLKGYKILVDEWYRYVPYLTCCDSVLEYLKDRYGNGTSLRFVEVYRRLSHISDDGQPITDPQSQHVDYSEYIMVRQPEQYKYEQSLTLYYLDPSLPEDDFLFLPEMRRVLRRSSASRCAPAFGTDFVPDDFRAGFNGGISRFEAHYLRDAKIVTLTDSDPHQYGNPANYYPLFFPKPVVGKWTVRDSYVIDVKRISSERSGYCYGRQVMYIDKYSFNILWKDIYDTSMNLWKIDMIEHIASDVPGEGVQFETSNWIQTMWDLKRMHLSCTLTAAPDGTQTAANAACRNLNGVNYDNVARYSTPGGLTEVMR